MDKILVLIYMVVSLFSVSATAEMSCLNGPGSTAQSRIIFDTAALSPNSAHAVLSMRHGGSTFFTGLWDYSKNASPFQLDLSPSDGKKAVFFKNSNFLGIINRPGAIKTVTLWDMETHQAVFNQEWPYTHWSQPNPEIIDLSPNQDQLAILVTGGGYQKLVIYDVHTNFKKSEFDFGSDTLASFKFESDSSILITSVNEKSNFPAQWSSKILRLNLSTGEVLTIFEEKDKSRSRQIWGISTARLIVTENSGTSGGYENLLIFDISSTPAKILATVPNTAVFAAERNIIVAASHRYDYMQDGNVRVLDFDGNLSNENYQSVVEAAAIKTVGEGTNVHVLNEKGQICRIP